MTGSDGQESSRRAWWRKSQLADYLGLGATVTVLLLVFGLATENFYSWNTFLAVANQVPDITIVAVGMTFVLMIAGIDLSVGSVMALCSAVLGVALVQWELPVLPSLVLSLGIGFLCGILNGWVSTRWRVPSFIVTLGMLEAARGAAYWTTDSRTVYVGDHLAWVTQSSVVGIPLPFVLALSLVVIGQIVLSLTLFGRYVEAVGSNEEAVRYAGIDTRRIKQSVFALCGAASGLAAVLHTSRLSSANPNAGVGLELQAIAAVVIGGTSLMGGRGSVIRSFLGVLIISLLAAGLAQVGAREASKRMITGVVIIVAVIADYYRTRRG